MPVDGLRISSVEKKLLARLRSLIRKPRKRARGHIDYTLRVKVHAENQPVAVALIEANAEHLPPTHGLEQGKAYATCKRLNVQFVFSSNGLSPRD